MERVGSPGSILNFHHGSTKIQTFAKLDQTVQWEQGFKIDQKWSDDDSPGVCEIFWFNEVILHADE